MSTPFDYKNAKLLWLDLEMTGLNPSTDRILEVAAIATDIKLTKQATYETGVLQDRAEIEALLGANEFAVNRPDETQELITISMAGKPEKQVEKELLSLLSEAFGDAPVFLAGNSIHADRGFIKQWWPELHARLHYRMLDVTSWKIIFEGQYQRYFVKKEQHRALADIEESIAELKFYQKFIKP